MLNKKKPPSLLHTYMSKFKDFLKMNEAGAGPVAPTLTAGADWQFPTSQTFAVPTSFTAMAQKNNFYDKPLFQALQKAQYLVQNIVSDPSMYGITNSQIVGTPRTGGNISGMNYNRMISAGASRGLRFLPTEFDVLEKKGIFTITPAMGTTPETVSINLKVLYDTMKHEIGTDVGKDRIAAAADAASNALTGGLVTPGNGAMTLGRHQYNV